MPNRIIISNDHGLYGSSTQYAVNSINSLNNQYKIGDIYHGTVNKLLPSINSAFIKLKRTNKYLSTGFIYIKDLKCIKRVRPINNDLNVHTLYQLVVPRQKIITQVVKEMHFEKGPRLTTIVVLNGHYLKLLPYSTSIYVSTKIQDFKLRNALKAVGKLIASDGMGIFFKINALGVNTTIILKELYLLKQHWFFISKRILDSKNIALMYREDNLISNSVRDYYLSSSNRIFLDNINYLPELKYFIHYWKCSLSSNNSTDKKIYLYKNNADFWHSTNLDLVVINLFNNIVHLPYGGYLFLETINAMTIIDVNSGTFNSNHKSRDSILKVNLAAAKEIVYQIIVRNIAGIILIDFIDMKAESDKELLLEYLFTLLENDNNQSTIIQYSKLGIVEITRKRATKSFSTLRQPDCNTTIKFSDTNIFHEKKILFDIFEHSTLFL